MTSTEFSIGMSGERNSSRVLKPPGGGHTNIFGESEAAVPSPRPKYDQQNSSNLNFCMNTVDPNILIEKTKQVVEKPEPRPTAADFGPSPSSTYGNGPSNGNSAAAAAPRVDGGQTREELREYTRGGASRVPPGGFSSGGFW